MSKTTTSLLLLGRKAYFGLALFLVGLTLLFFRVASAASPVTLTIDSDTDFNQGIYSQTELSGAGAPAYVQLGTGAGPDSTTYRQTISIDNSGNASVLSEYQVLIENIDTATLIAGGKMQSSCQDLRFSNYSETTTLPYFIVSETCNTANTRVWVQVDSIAASATTNILMFYGAPAAADAQSEQDVFSYTSEQVVAYALDSSVNELKIISLEDGNSISHNGNNFTMDLGDTASFPSVNRFQPISSTKLFNAEDTSEDTDAIVPMSWAGTEFMGYARSNTDVTVHSIAPFGNATVTMYNNGTAVSNCTGFTVASTGTQQTCATSTGRIRITSDLPILVFFELGSGDPMPLNPSSTDTWYGGSRSTLVLANGSGADYRYIRNTDSSELNPSNLAADAYANLSGNSYAASPGYAVRSVDNPIVAHQYADGDGSDASMFRTKSQFGTRWGSAASTDYITVFSNQPFSCEVFVGGTSFDTGSGSSSNSDIYYLGFGAGDSNVYTASAWYMDCDAPVAAAFQKNNGSESSLITYQDMRQVSYPEPSISGFGSEQPAIETGGSWASDNSSNVIDLNWNGGWGNGTGTSTAFSAQVANVSANATIEFQAKVAQSLATLDATGYTSIGAVSSGTTFVATKDDLDSAGLNTGDYRYLQVRAVLASINSIDNPQLDSIQITYLEDRDPPATNGANIAMQRYAGGPAVLRGEWTNGGSPYFDWEDGTDAESGIAGYCLYVGQDDRADPVTTKGLLGTSPIDTTDTDCLNGFIIDDSEIDFVTASYKGATWLTSDLNLYYLIIKSIDNAGNAYTGATTTFEFKYDGTEPTNPLYVSAPSYFVSNKAVTLTWPTAGRDGTEDDHSGVAGLQYRIGTSGTWYGDMHNGNEDQTDLLEDDGSYTTVDPEDFDVLVEGNNLVYFRTWDLAGNVSTAHVTTMIRLSTVSPTPPQNVTPSPALNTENSFAFSWLAPASFIGSEGNITYCYTVNSLPNASNCVFTAAGVTWLSTGAYATQPGMNTIYVVARDEANNISYDAYGQASFEANTAAPGVPQNSDVADISVKATSNWKLAVTWEEPADVGAGIDHYLVYRSLDGTNFSQIASVNSESYVDDSLAQVEYYYYAEACDSANNCGAPGATVSLMPTGKFTEPADLVVQPDVVSVSTRKATIEWATDRTSDSRIAYGTSSGVYSADEVANSEHVTNHEINLTNLAPGTTYFYIAKWTDEDGNTGLSAEKSFQTQPAPVVKSVEVRRVTLTTATIEFTTIDATSVELYYGISENFGGLEQINTSVSESTYVTELVGLNDGQEYFFKLNPVDVDGNEYDGTVLTFETPPRPRITNLRFENAEEEATSTQIISWTTNVPTTSQVIYGVDGGPSKEKIDSELLVEHQMVINDLRDDSLYTIIVQSRDIQSNLALSDKNTFQTALDTRPPKVFDILVESNIRGSGNEARGQIIVSWRSDEPSSSRVAYGEGSGGGNYSNLTASSDELTTEHIVVVSDLAPSNVYHLQVRSLDEAGNEGASEDQSVIVGRPSDSVLTIILNSLKKIFGL